MKISPQEKQILDLLADGLKHCSTFECYMKDDRARISALRKKGFIFNEGAGYCTDKAHNHHSQVKLRQLLSWPISQGGLTAGRHPHKVEIAGSIPAPATKLAQSFLQTFCQPKKEEKELTLF